MTVNIDGTSFTPTGKNNTLIALTENGEAARRFDLRTNVNGGILDLAFSMWDVKGYPDEGVLEKVYAVSVNHPKTHCHQPNSNSSHCDGSLITFFLVTNSLDGSYWSLGEDDLNSHVTITDNDPVNHTVTGAFDAIIVNDDAADTMHVSGTFTNACYSYYK